MYNEKHKLEYLANQGLGPSSGADFLTVANGVEKMETRLGKDLDHFSRDEVILYVNNLELTNPLTIKKYLAVIRAYQVSADPNCDLADHPIRKTEIDIVSAMQKRFYSSYQDLLAKIEYGVGLSEGYPEPVALTLAWLGLGITEARELKSDHVDLKEGVIQRYPERDIVFGIDEPKALQTLRIYANTVKAYRTRNTTYEVYHPKNNPYFLHTMVPIGAQNKKIHPMSTTLLTSGFTMMRKKALENGHDVTYTYTDVLRSGELYRLYQAEKKGLSVTSKINADIVCSMVSGGIPYFELLFQYKTYKQAFNLT